MPRAFRPSLRTLWIASIAVLAASAVACEPGDAHLTGPKGASAFARFIVIGSDLSMGVESGGVVAATQGASWPAIIAYDAGAAFRQPLFRAPGCSSPLVAPLLLGRWVSGAATTARDSTCAGAAVTLTPPADNLAIAGATAWAALNLSPKTIAAAPASYDIVDRERYPFVLASTQSQVTAMLVQAPTFVGFELGSAEVMTAATTGLVTAATSYTQTTPFTYVPAAVAAPVLAAIVDSVAKASAKVVVLSIPRATKLPVFRRGSEVAGQRSALAGYGVTVSADCDGSANLLNLNAKITPLVQKALTTGAAQALSCADVPGTVDRVLTPGDAAALDAAVDQMNTQLKQLAASHGWAYVDLAGTYDSMILPAGAYRASAHLSCAQPYGIYYSLDGLLPSPAGQHVVADAVAAAINTTYGLGLPVRGVTLELQVNPCP